MKYIMNLLERTLSTYVEAVVTFALMQDTLGVDTWKAAAISAIPAGLSLLSSGLPAVPEGLPFYVDVLLRAVRTYAVTFIGLWIAIVPFTLDVTTAQAAALAAIPAALAIVKSGIAGMVGRSGSAALLPASSDPAPLKFGP